MLHNLKTNTHDYRIGSASGSSVDSMEFTALLEGLDLALQQPVDANFRRASSGDFRRAVLWRSDRESLVRSVAGLYARSNLPEYWCRFAYYEKRILLIPVHIGREEENNFPEFRFCDLQASTQREVLKGYLETIHVPW